MYLKKTIKGDFKAPRNFDKKVSRSLEAICLKAMKTRPKNRYQSVNALIDDISLYLIGYAPKAEKPSFIKKLQLSIRRRPLTFASLLTSLLFSALILSSANFQLQEKNLTLAEQREEIAIQKAEIEKHLKSAEDSRDELQKIAHLAAIEAFAKAKEHYNNFRIYKALELVETSTCLEPNNLVAQDLKLEALLSTFRMKAFWEQVEVIKELKTPASRKVHLIESVNLTKDTPPQKVLELIRVLYIHRWNHLGQRIALSYLSKSAHNEEKLHLVKSLYSLFNKEELKHFSANYIDGFYEIDLSKNTGLKSLSFLKGLKLSSLNLSGSAIPDLNDAPLFHVKELDLSHCHLTPWLAYNFNTLMMPKLETLILDKPSNSLTTLDGLAGTPIKHLSLRGVYNIQNFDFLHKMKYLEKLTVDILPTKLPEKFLPLINMKP